MGWVRPLHHHQRPRAPDVSGPSRTAGTLAADPWRRARHHHLRIPRAETERAPDRAGHREGRGRLHRGKLHRRIAVLPADRRGRPDHAAGAFGTDVDAAARLSLRRARGISAGRRLLRRQQVGAAGGQREPPDGLAAVARRRRGRARVPQQHQGLAAEPAREVAIQTLAPDVRDKVAAELATA